MKRKDFAKLISQKHHVDIFNSIHVKDNVATGYVSMNTILSIPVANVEDGLYDAKAWGQDILIKTNQDMSDYPDTPERKDDEFICSIDTLNIQNVSNALDKSQMFAHHILLSTNENKEYFVCATNGSVLYCEGKNKEFTPKGHIIEIDCIKPMLTEKSCDMYASKDHLYFVNENYTITQRKKDVQYPNFHKIIPDLSTYNIFDMSFLTVGSELYTISKKLGSTNNQIKYVYNEGILTVENFDRAKDMLYYKSIPFDKEFDSVPFNGEFLKKTFNVKGNKILYFKDPDSSMFIQTEQGFIIIMPFSQLYDYPKEYTKHEIK